MARGGLTLLALALASQECEAFSQNDNNKWSARFATHSDLYGHDAPSRSARGVQKLSVDAVAFAQTIDGVACRRRTNCDRPPIAECASRRPVVLAVD